jgi:carbonic anhydrase
MMRGRTRGRDPGRDAADRTKRLAHRRTRKDGHMKPRLTIIALAAAALAILLTGCSSPATSASAAASASASPAVHTRRPPVTSPVAARTLLADGNARFLSDALLPRDLSQTRRDELATGQTPFAVIVTCSDSRVPPELIFDQAFGDIFVVRVAGNVIDPVTLGSVEYAAEHLHAPLVVIMGHTHCGAVDAAVEGGEAPGDIAAIVRRIKPAVALAKAAGASGADLAAKSVLPNVELQTKATERSQILEELVHKGKLRIVGAVYDIKSGAITWL